MSSRYLSITLAISFLLLLSALPFSKLLPLEIWSESSSSDSESLLSRKRGILFSSASEADLQLIPGISDKKSAEILKNRELLIKRAQRLQYSERHKAMEAIKGIGEKTAAKIAPYLQLDK